MTTTVESATPADEVAAKYHFSNPGDIDEFITMVERFERGEITPDAFRAYRLVRGVYGQRQDDVHMLRVKVPLGALVAAQLDAFGEVAALSPRGIGHVTTRQNFQFHFIPLTEMEPLMRILDQVGLTTRAACGNSVRNVTGDPRAGLSPDEIFDATPFGEAVVRYMLRHPLSETLPRKFKIAVCGDPSDPAWGAINDIGLIGHRAPDGSRRFKVLAGGGLSTVPTNAFVLHDSYPVERINEVVEALVRVFDKTGDRKNRHKARMKFVVKKLGQEAFVALYQQTLSEVLKSPPPPIVVPDLHREPPAVWALPPFADPELKAFVRTNVSKTRFVGRTFVIVRLSVGDITAAQFHGLAEIARRMGDGKVQLTIDQNLIFRDVRVEDLARFYRELKTLDLATPGAGTSSDVTSCPGADSCKLAITHSRDLAKVLTTELEKAAEDGVRIRLSGCPNSCGGHQVATIGFHGAVRKIGGKAAPHYSVQVGGKIDAGGARFGRVVGKIPARRVQEAIARLIAYGGSIRGPDETVNAALERAPVDGLKAAIADLMDLGENDSRPDDFLDFGSNVPFELVTMEGECAA